MSSLGLKVGMFGVGHAQTQRGIADMLSRAGHFTQELCAYTAEIPCAVATLGKLSC